MVFLYLYLEFGKFCKLIGTTKPTIAKIRAGEHSDMSELKPKNPVAIGLCNEKDLENALAISAVHNKQKDDKKKVIRKNIK